MGFWFTGYFDFHEPTGLDPPFVPPPVTYQCSLCLKVFSALEAYEKHRFEAHPRIRPALLIRGMEIGDSEFALTSPLRRNDISVVGASKATLNGIAFEPDTLARELLHISQSTADIVLEHEGVRASFRLRIELASEEDLTAVEAAFKAMAARRRLDRRAVEEFIGEARRAESALRYIDGICEYLYGVLAKQESGVSSIGHDRYPVRFTRASEILASYGRPLAYAIRGLVAFNFNQFDSALNLSPNTRVSMAAQRYSEWLEGRIATSRSCPQLFGNRIDTFLTDFETEEILKRCMQPLDALARDLPALEDRIKRAMSGFDRAKMLVLAAEASAYSGHRDGARWYARELRNTRAFESWVAHFDTAQLDQDQDK